MMATMSAQETSRQIPSDDPLAVELRLAVHGGDVGAVQRLLRNDPGLASARLGGRGGGTATALHLVTDWPGYFPNGPEIVWVLIDAGADPNALTTSQGTEPGPGSETPLHYAASSDDVGVAEALIDAGADIEVPDGSIGTPLDNAVGYGCWHVARLLVARGARVDKAWHAAALGMLGRLEALLGSDPPADSRYSAAQTSTGSRTTPMAHRLTPPARGVPCRRTSSPGCVGWEPGPSAPIEDTHHLRNLVVLPV